MEIAARSDRNRSGVSSTLTWFDSVGVLFLVKWAAFAVIGVVFLFLAYTLLFPKRGPKEGVILIIRHAEKPDDGAGLSKKGVERADAYVRYFADYKVGTAPLQLKAIFSTADTKASQRPRVTVQPTATRLHLLNDSQFGRDQTSALADELRSKYEGKQVLISWHHGGIPDLLRAFGTDPKALLPDGEWPDGVFNWVIQLRFDREGRLVSSESKRITAHLLLGDSR